jgi:hypothetical protein
MTFIDRVAGVAGIGAGVYLLFLPGCVCDLWMPRVGGDMSPEDPSSVIASTLIATNGSRRVSAYLGLLAVFLLVIFFARLHGALRVASGPVSWMPTLTVAGGVLLGGVLLVEVGIAFASSELASYGGETEVVRLFVLWGWNSASLLAPPLALALTGTTVVAFSSTAFPKWYRWASLVLLGLLVLIAVVIRAPGLGIAPGMLWVFLTSFVLILRPNLAMREPLSKGTA